MAKSIASFKNGSVDKVGVLDIKVIKKISDDCYIVGDEKDHIVLVSEQTLQSGLAYRLIKPSYEEMKLRKNPKFSAVKIEKDITTKTLVKKDEDILCASVTKDEKILSNDINTFVYSKFDKWVFGLC